MAGNSFSGHCHNFNVTGKLVVGSGSSDMSAVNIMAQGTTQLYALGTTLIYGDRTFRYCKMGATATAGKLMITAAADSNHRDIVAVATDANSSIITVTLGSAAAAINLYAEGYLHVNDGPAQGLFLKIKSHPQANSGATCAFTMYDPLGVVALTTSSKIDLILNPYSGVVPTPASASGVPGSIVGVTIMDSTNANYAWLQISGPCSCLYTENPTGATIAIGDIVIRNDTVIGSVMGPGASGGDEDAYHTVLGSVMVLNDATDNIIVWLNGI
jgi:hypothetical protein